MFFNVHDPTNVMFNRWVVGVTCFSFSRCPGVRALVFRYCIETWSSVHKLLVSSRVLDVCFWDILWFRWLRQLLLNLKYIIYYYTRDII